jgi:alkylation response protein AidB-like acyl-CoA dehydrogenase
MQECERAGRDDGLAAGLAIALAGTDVAATAPGRYAAVAERDVPPGAAVRRHSLADREGVVFVECPGDRPQAAAGLSEIGRLFAAVRLGLVRRTLDLAVEHLSGRESGGEPLVRKQLVIGAIADVIAGVELLREQALSQRGTSALGDLHYRLDELGWQVTKLFGAAGYIADHPARALYVAALGANTWIDREGAVEP